MLMPRWGEEEIRKNGTYHPTILDTYGRTATATRPAMRPLGFNLPPAAMRRVKRFRREKRRRGELTWFEYQREQND